METVIINALYSLTFGSNNDVKMSAIMTLGDYKATIQQDAIIFRLIELCSDPNKEIAKSAIESLSKLSRHFDVLN